MSIRLAVRACLSFSVLNLLLEWVLLVDLNHRARAVYMYLKDHADSEGKCWPGIRTISAELRLSRSTVKRALDDLCRAELISKERRFRENGSLSSNLSLGMEL